MNTFAVAMGKSNGFTLIEVLLALFFTVVIAYLFPLFIQTLPSFDPIEEFHPTELQLFFNQLATEVREAERISVSSLTSFRLNLRKTSGYLITIEKYGDRVRRRVDGLGHDIMLQKIDYLHFKQVNNGIIVTVEDQKGNSYKRRFSSYIESE